jgi:hypothetical protein
MRATSLGVVMLPRTIDKAKAAVHGTLGGYLYNYKIDAMLFEFLGLDPNEFLEVVRTAHDDAQIEAYVRAFVAAKSAAEIEAFNARMLGLRVRAESPYAAAFRAQRERIAPDRTDVTTWADLFDLEEGRDVPHRVASV